MSERKLLLNVGSFTEMSYSAEEACIINIDMLDLTQFAIVNGYNFHQIDVRKGLPYGNSSVDIILAQHFLEHFTRSEGKAFLRECFRVLKPGALIRIAVPNTELICDKYLKYDIKQYGVINVGVDKAEDDAEALYELLVSGHKTFHDGVSLAALLKEAGFTEIRDAYPFVSRSEAIMKQTNPTYAAISIYVEAVKPESPWIPHGASVDSGKRDEAATESEAEQKRSTSGYALNSRLRVGLISTRFFGVPPKGYSGLEMIVWDLAIALSKLGHEVTIFGPEGSQAPPNGHVVITGPALNTVGVDWVAAEREAFNIYRNHVAGLDVVHGNNWFGFEYNLKPLYPNLKVCHTHHGGLNMEWWGRSKPPYRLNMIAISDWMRRVYESQGFSSKYVYNGVDLSKYPLQEKKGERLLFVGRLDSFKQPHIAIEVAKKLGVGIDIVGGSFVSDQAYMNRVTSMCDGIQVKLHKDASHEVKIGLMQNAKCLLFPSQMGEPFGLVAVEAMSCGCPVVTLNDGAIDEVVKEGGVVCNVFTKILSQGAIRYDSHGDPVAMLAEAVQKLNVSPISARRNAERFSRRNMGLAYEKLYQEILSGSEW